MAIQLKSEWMLPRVETLKILHNLGDGKYNEDLESIQYSDREKTKTILVIANQKGKPGDVNTNMARKLKAFIDDTDFKTIFVFGELQTASAYNLLKYNDKATVYTSNARIQLRTEDILEAFHTLAGSMCEMECSVKPVKRSDCKATLKGAETCPIRTLIDNADFHARMKWKDQLLEDLSKLMEYKQELLAIALK